MKEEILKKIAKHLKMRFPTSQISRDLNYSQGVISQYINGKKEISERFREDFEKFYNVKFSDFSEEKETTQEEEIFNINFQTGLNKRIETIKEEILEYEEKLKKVEEEENQKLLKEIINLKYETIKIIEEAKLNKLEEELRIKKENQK